MDRRVHAQDFFQASFEEWCMQFVVVERAECTILVSPVIFLFFMDSLSVHRRSVVQSTSGHWAETNWMTGLAAKCKRNQDPVTALVCWPAIRSAIIM